MLPAFNCLLRLCVSLSCVALCFVPLVVFFVRSVQLCCVALSSGLLRIVVLFFSVCVSLTVIVSIPQFCVSSSQV